MAYASLLEYFDYSYDRFAIWSGGVGATPVPNLQAVLDYLRDRADLDLGDRPIDFERFRGQDAAEKWAATGQ